MTTSLGVDQDQLRSLIDTVKNDPEAGKTLWQARTEWRGGLKSQATIPRESGAFTVPMDEPTGLGGTDTAPNMVEMVLGAYGCCLTTGYVLNAALEGVELEGIEIELEGDLDLQGFLCLKDPEEVRPGFTDIRAKITLKAPQASREQLETLHSRVVRTSPVGSIIEQPVRLTTELT